jgi:regulator of Ty1 transposition protein 103
MEALTPPAMEAFTPPPAFEEPPVPTESISVSNGLESAGEAQSSVAPPQSVPISANGSNKRRRVDDGDFPDLGADDGIDEDVAAMLKEGSGS